MEWDEASVQVSKDRTPILLTQYQANTDIETVTRTFHKAVFLGERRRHLNVYLERGTYSVALYDD